VHSAALPGISLKHAAHRFGQADVGVGDHQAHPREAALIEASQVLTSGGFSLADAHLQPKQLTAAFSVDAHRQDA
jgi:hypothetical protein